MSLSETVDFHMVEGGGRASGRSGTGSWGCLSAPVGAGRVSDPGMRAGRFPSPQPRGPVGPLPLAGPLRDTPRLAAGHLRARHVLPPGPAPRTPPWAGGGNRRPRPDSASLEAGSSGGGAGAAGRSGRPGV